MDEAGHGVRRDIVGYLLPLKKWVRLRHEPFSTTQNVNRGINVRGTLTSRLTVPPYGSSARPAVDVLSDRLTSDSVVREAEVEVWTG